MASFFKRALNVQERMTMGIYISKALSENAQHIPISILGL